MAEKITLKLSAASAAVVRKDAPKETKLQAARGALAVAAADLGALLFFLGHDPDPEVRAAAIKRVREMPETEVLALIGSSEAHPKVLDMLARLHYPKPAVVAQLVSHPAIADETRTFLADKGMMAGGAAADEAVAAAGREETGEEGEVDEESEEFKSKYKLSLEMGIAEKIKMALTGDKEWRTLLIKDSNKLVSGAVVKNPRISEPEILAISKSAIQNDEILRVICLNKEWIKNYQIRKALVLNCKTPLPAALRFLGSLTEKDIASLAKSKNVSTVIANQARRLLLGKKRH